MKMKERISSQSGAALLITLFVVVLLGIVGTVMLQATTYGLKHVVNNSKEQKEFYRAEGALEIALAEMNEYQNEDGSGPYFYLLDHEIAGSIPSYSIGTKEMAVTVSTEPDVRSVTPKSETQQIDVTLKANYKTDSTISRVLTVEMELYPETTGIHKNGFLFVDGDQFRDNGQVKVDYATISRSDYHTILSGSDIDWSDYDAYDKLDHRDIKEGQPYVLPEGSTHLSEINIQGQDRLVIIPEDAVVFAESVVLAGTRQATAQLIIDGSLVTKDFHNKGNSVLTLNGGLITYNYMGTSMAFEINGQSDGVDCELLPAVCGLEKETGAYASTLLSESIDFSTER